MEIILASERIYCIQAQVDMETARARVDEKRVNLVAGMMGALLTRPKPDDIVCTYAETRLEPFWRIGAHLRTVYDRQRSYTVVVGGDEVRQVTVSGQTLPVARQSGTGPAFTLTGTEHCEEAVRVAQTFDGSGSARPELGRLTTLPAWEIPDLQEFRPEALVVMPEARAAAVVRQVMSEVVRPVKAQVIHEERLTVESIDLFFRPVYAFEYNWAAKGKRVVVEFNALTGETTTGGKTLKERLQGVLKRDMLFDISADAVGMVVPGGSIAVKLVKAVVDQVK